MSHFAISITRIMVIINPGLVIYVKNKKTVEILKKQENILNIKLQIQNQPFSLEKLYFDFLLTFDFYRRNMLIRVKPVRGINV